MRRPGGRYLRALVWTIAATLAACQRPPTPAAQDFVAAANALAQAESDYFDQIQAASDASIQLINGFYYADGKMPWTQLAPRLARRHDFAKAKALRMAVMAQLQDYARQIAAIATASGDTGITDAAKADAADVVQLGQNSAVLKISASQLTLVQTAVADLSQAITSNQAAQQFQSLAQQAAKPIAAIASMVEADKGIVEDTGYAPNLATDQTTAVTAILGVIYADPRVNSAERMQVFAHYTADWKPVLVTKGKDIAEAMKKLQNANDAMKAGLPLAASTWAQEAYQLAMQALATQPVRH